MVVRFSVCLSVVPRLSPRVSLYVCLCLALFPPDTHPSSLAWTPGRTSSRMPKVKTSAGGDFKKKKQKLGKKKLAPTNATDTTVKVKTIALPEQSQTVSKSGPTTHRNLTMAELMAQLKHYSSDVRTDALGGLHELLVREASLSQAPLRLCLHLLHALLHASAPRPNRSAAHPLCPGHPSQHSAELLAGVLPMFVDASAAARRAALGVLRALLPPLVQADRQQQQQ